MEHEASAEAGFICETVTVTTAVMKPEIKDTLCRKQLIHGGLYRTPESLRPTISER
jgi:hypothetical protein